MKYLNLLAVIIITAFFNVLSAQEITGLVKAEDQTAIAEVSIRINDKEFAKTDQNGRFYLSEKFRFPVEITLEHPDYLPMTLVLSVNNQIIYLTERSIIENLDMVVVSAKVKNGNNLIIPTSLITSEVITRQSPIDLVAAINQTPGVFIQNGALNTNRLVVRGIGSRTLFGTSKVRAYFNEIPITNGVGETSIDSYNSEDLNTLEIVKGPKATLYGTSLGGALLLTSKKPQAPIISFSNSTTLGSFGLFKNSVSTDVANENFTLHINYDHLRTDGFRDNSTYERDTALLTSSYAFTDNTQLNVLINYTDNLAQIPSSINKADFDEDPSQAAFTWKQAKGFENNKQILSGLSVDHRFSETFSNTTSVFYTYLDHYEPRPFNILDEYTNGHGARSVFSYAFGLFNRKAEFTVGSEWLRDIYHWSTFENRYQETNGNGSLQGEALSNNKEKRNQLSIFSTLTLPFTSQLKMQVGLNYNKTHYDYTDNFNIGASNRSLERDFKGILAPSLNVLYEFDPDKSAYANISYGFNYPNLEETLTPDSQINPEIGPEQGFNYELGTELYFFNRKLHLLSSIYIMDVKDLLVAQRVNEDQYIGKNAGKTIHKGLEVALDYKFRIDENLQVSPFINASFEFHKFVEFMDEDIDYSGNELTGVPNTKIASGFAFSHNNGLSLDVNHLYVGEMPMNDANTLYSDPYNLIHLKARYRTEILKQLGLEMHFGINNILDKTYAASILINAVGFNGSQPRYFYPGNPRNFYGGLKLNYYL